MVGTVASSSRDRQLLRVILLAGLYCIPPAIALRPIVDVDIWWHLHQGAWIVANKTVPLTDPFTSYGVGKTWIAYSWLYELVVYGLYRCFGLFGIVLYTALLGFAIALALHHLLRRQTDDDLVASGLTALALAGMLPTLAHPRPWLFNVLFVILELTVLLEVRRSGRQGLLLALPPLFLIWACINIQFVYGLFVLVLAIAEPLIQRWTRGADTGSLGVRPMFLTLVACIVATGLTPYHVRVYLPVITAVVLTDPFLFLSELQAPSFRHIFDWLAFGLLLGAVYTVGRRRIASPFLVLLVATGALVGFRARRDMWVLLIASVAVLAMVPVRAAIRRTPPLGARRTMLVASIVLMISLWLAMSRVSPSRLDSELRDTFPVDAAAFVERHGYRGRLYNHYDWGGYLMWRLPALDVSLDGRNPLHGDARIWESIRTWRGYRDWASDPELAKATLVIGDVNAALSSLLRGDPRFTLVYEDEIAAVFRRD